MLGKIISQMEVGRKLFLLDNFEKSKGKSVFLLLSDNLASLC